VTEDLPSIPRQDDRSDQNFDIVLRGYERNQVDRHVGHLEQLLAEAHAEVERLQDGRPSYRELGGRIAQMLTLAEEQADEIRAEAFRATEDIRQRAAEAAEAAEQDGRERREALDREESERRGALDREESERRGALDREESERRERSRREEQEASTAARERSGHIVAEAEHEADSITAAARQELDRLGQRRDEIRSQLEALRERLGAAVSGVVAAQGTPGDVAATAGDEPQTEHTTTVLEAGPGSDNADEPQG
jgi:chromosome segregation ATPase